MSRVLILLAVLAGVLASPAGARAARPLGLPSGTPVLFTVQAERGTLVRVPRTRDRFVLTLRGVPSQALWFSDRPNRDSGSLRMSRFVGAWKRLGFRSDPPNAVISVTGAKRKSDTLAVELQAPRYDRRARTVRFRVRTLRKVSTGLAHLGPKLDVRIPARFGESALFVDDGTVGPSLCEYAAQLDLYPASILPQGYVQADGQMLRVSQYMTLFALVQSVFGGDGYTTFAVPDPAVPAGLQYDLCAGGLFPAAASSDYDPGASCTTGTIALQAQHFQPMGWVPADGRTLQISRAGGLYSVIGTAFGGDGRTTFAVPSVPAPPNLGYYVCANGDRWSPGSPQTECIVSQLELFATRSLPSNYVPADGRVVSIAQYQLLYMRFGTAFGGDGESTLGIPNVPGPVAGTQYAMCADGYYPST